MRKKLQLLRELDSIIDFSRASQQLEVVTYMGVSARSASIEEIVENLGIERKQALDTLRKLGLKGIIAERGSLYELTERGKEFYKRLAEDLEHSFRDRGVKAPAQWASSTSGITTALLLVEILRILFTMGGSSALEKISKIVRRTPREILEQLGPFIKDQGARGFLELSTCEKGFFRKRALRCLRISGEGLLLISRAPEIVRYTYLEKILRRILGTGDLEEASERILLIATSAFAASLYLQGSGVEKIALLLSFTVLVFLTSLYIASRRLFTKLVFSQRGRKIS